MEYLPIICGLAGAGLIGWPTIKRLSSKLRKPAAKQVKLALVEHCLELRDAIDCPECHAAIDTVIMPAVMRGAHEQ